LDRVYDKLQKTLNTFFNDEEIRALSDPVLECVVLEYYHPPLLARRRGRESKRKRGSE